MAGGHHCRPEVARVARVRWREGAGSVRSCAGVRLRASLPSATGAMLYCKFMTDLSPDRRRNVPLILVAAVLGCVWIVRAALDHAGWRGVGWTAAGYLLSGLNGRFDRVA
jgi:hypothetical protein